MPQPLEDQRTTVYKVDREHPANPTLPTLRTEEMMLNMGPQHPSTHGVLKIVLSLEGERIVKATPVMGFLHRGVEKLAEDGTYHQFIPHTDRLDYVCAMYNNFAYCRAVEKLLDLKVPPRAEYLRTIAAEDALNFGLSGPTLRGSSVDYDLRKFEPYAAYGECQWSVPVGKNGDTYDRYWVRVEEMRQSRNMVKQLLEKIPDGPVMADMP